MVDDKGNEIITASAQTTMQHIKSIEATGATVEIVKQSIDDDGSVVTEIHVEDSSAGSN